MTPPKWKNPKTKLLAHHLLDKETALNYWTKAAELILAKEPNTDAATEVLSQMIRDRYQCEPDFDTRAIAENLIELVKS